MTNPLPTGATVQLAAPAVPSITAAPPEPTNALVLPRPGNPGIDGTNGTDGTDGQSAYQIAVDNGFVGTEQQWLASLAGAAGADGTDGTDGASAYQVAVNNGFVGTQAQWLASLEGAPGPTWTPPFILLPCRWTTDFGNGLDGRTPAVNCAAGALGAGYCFGWSGPWSAVDVYAAWLEYSGSGNVVFSTYLKSVADGGGAAGKTLLSNQVAYPVSNIQFGYHETLVASNVAVTPNVMATGTVARYGNIAADTYAQAVGVIGIILRPH